MTYKEFELEENLFNKLDFMKVKSKVVEEIHKFIGGGNIKHNMMERNINMAVYGIVLSRILHYGLTSGLFNTIALSKNGMTLEEISDKYPKFDRERLGRFLNAATSSNLLVKKNQWYLVIKENKKYYIKTSDSNLTFFMNHMLYSTSSQYDYLEESLCNTRERSDNDIFEILYDDSSRLTSFLDAMWSIGYADTLEIIKSHLFNKVERVVDLGGGSGVFSILCLLNDKAKNATVFDLPQIEFYVNNKMECLNLANRLQFHAGNFFKDAYPKADLYSLGYICSDWDDETCISLISKVFDHLSNGGQIMIMEKLFNESKVEPFETAMMDLCMMVETQGKHRSYNEYKEMLESVGFRDIRLIRTEGEKHAILGRR